MTPGIVSVVMIAGSGTGVTHDQMVACAAALNIQTQEHFALPPPHGWGIAASVRVGRGAFDVKPDEWVLALLSKADVAGALGYHDQTVHGQPVMKVFPLLDAADGQRWESTASHELLETLADPNTARCVQSWDQKVWALEVCDACEQQSYLIHGVPMSDFVLPPYFEPVKSMQGLKFDWMGKITQPLEILPGGYGQWLDPSKGWTQVLAQRVVGDPSKLSGAMAEPIMPREYRQHVPGRGARRRS